MGDAGVVILERKVKTSLFTPICLTDIIHDYDNLGFDINKGKLFILPQDSDHDFF